jgi:hypothetical protein
MPPSRNRLVAAAMVLAAPAIVAGAYLFHFISNDSPRFVPAVADQHTRFVVGGLIMTVAGFLFVPTAIGLTRLAVGRGRETVTVGAVLVAIGGMALAAGDLMITLIMGALTPDHVDLAHRVQDVAMSSALTGLPFMFAPALVLGLVIACIGLLLDGFRPGWLPVALGLSAVAIDFAPDGLGSPLMHAPLALSIACLGVVLFRRPTPALVEPAPPVPELV